MIDELDALIALADHEKMHLAARQLHISQSAVSKRIANLQELYGEAITQRDGRRIVLTPAGASLLEKARPLVKSFHELFSSEATGPEAEVGEIALDISVSALLSFGSKALTKIKKCIPGIDFRLNVYHSSTAIDRVRNGASELALIIGQGRMAPQLMFLPIIDIPFVIVPSGLKVFKLKPGSKVPVMTLEAPAKDWMIIDEQFNKNRKRWRCSIEITRALQSFTAVAELAKAGFGHGFVPLGSARSLGIPNSKLIHLPDPGVKVPVSLVGLQRTFAKPLVQNFYNKLLEIAEHS